MKRLLITALTVMFIFCGQLMQNVNAAPVWNMPTYVMQPNGDTLHCFVTGDEFYQRLHDAENYTIVQNPATGYYVYAVMENGQLTPSQHIAGKTDPTTLGIEPGLAISYPELMERHKRFEIPAKYQTKATKAHSNHGVLNNIVIFIRFADDTTDITKPFSEVNNMYNDSSANAVSLFNYYQSATYKQLRIVTHFYPTPEGEQIHSYQDIHPRNYYRPYSAANPIGYTEDERNGREFDLLERATQYVDNLNLIPDDLIIDEDNNGEIDNISYVVKGGVGGWSELLWPHKWNLYDRDVYLHGTKVNTFNFILAEAGPHYFGTSTLCHEMFHALGAPDLYHYYNYTNTHPVGGWDLMEQNSNPPQHMGAYMKLKYGRWIDSIPTLRKQGTYSLRPLADPSNKNNCYKILSSDPNQYYVLEYRDRSYLFEQGLPGSGLIIYRINTLYNGNAEFDKEYYFDEVYAFRPYGNDTVSGEVNDAYFSPTISRTQFDYSTEPHPTLTNNIQDSSFGIHNIRIEGDSIVFDFIDFTGCRMPLNLSTREITGNSAELTWDGSNSSYKIEYGKVDEDYTMTETTTEPHLTLTNLVKDRTYRWRITGYCTDEESGEIDSSDVSNWITFTTMPCYKTINTLIGEGNNKESSVPVYTSFRYSYMQQIFSAHEMNNDSMSISKISFYYESSTPLHEKNDCKIYLGHVDRLTFTSRTDAVPIDSLQLVYEGPINCIKGWNSINLNENFEYNGEQNLVLAIDDNSGNFNDNAKFRTTNTTEFSTLGYYSSDDNPDPENLEEFRGISARKQHLSNVRFEGCDPAGDGDVKIDIIDDCDVTIRTSQLNINLNAPTTHNYQLFDISGRLLDQRSNQSSCTMRAPQGGVYLIRIDNTTTKKIVVF